MKGPGLKVAKIAFLTEAETAHEILLLRKYIIRFNTSQNQKLLIIIKFLQIIIEILLHLFL